MNVNKIFLIINAILLSLSCAASIFSNNTASCNYKNIIILAWGSLVKSPRNLEFEGEFKKINITFPIELSCVSFEGTNHQKLTRIIDKHWGHPMALWRAKSKNHTLAQAIDNLAEREYSSRDKIFYIKTIAPDQKEDTEIVITENDAPMMDHNGKMWCACKVAAQQLPQSKIIELVKWATAKNFDAVLWTGLTMTPGYDRDALVRLLKENPNTLQNTKDYILNYSPDLNELTQFEKNILNDDI